MSDEDEDVDGCSIGCGIMLLIFIAGVLAVFGSFVAKVSWHIIRWTWT